VVDVAVIEIAETEEAAQPSRRAKRAGLFDLRRIIGGLLGLYSIVLTVMGLVASNATRTEAAGINIDLWTGLALLAAAGAFLAWLALRPCGPRPSRRPRRLPRRTATPRSRGVRGSRPPANPLLQPRVFSASCCCGMLLGWLRWST
jgi:hypothetical protein